MAALGRVFVSVDFEGLPYIASLSHLLPGRSLYEEARRIAGELVKTVAGELLGRGAEEVVVADSHGLMNNFDPLDMPRGVRLVRGYPRPLSMVAGGRGASFAVFLGYHARAGAASVFSHTYSGSTVREVLVNGAPASEYLLNALVLGEWGVPVGLVAGSAELLEDVERHTPWAVRIALKESLGYTAAVSKSMEEIREELARGIEEAVEKHRRGELRPLRHGGELVIMISFASPAYAEAASLIPGVEQVDPVTAAYRTSSAEEAYKALEAMILAAAGARALLQLHEK